MRFLPFDHPAIEDDRDGEIRYACPGLSEWTSAAVKLRP